MKSYNCFFIKLFVVYVLFSIPVLLGMYTPEAFKMRQQYGLMRRRQPLLALGPSTSMQKQTHLVPADTQSMQELGLCPLFVKQESFQMDPALVQDMIQDLQKQGF